jgi:glycosyltransferase involved in cell wall biosynthesis
MKEQKESGMNKKNIVILTAVHPYKASGRSVTDLKNVLKAKGHKVVIVTNDYLREELEDVISVKSLFTVLQHKVSSKIISIIGKEKSKDSNYYMYDQNSHKRKFDTAIILKKLPFKPDVFIYLFQQDFLNEEALYDLNKSTGAPIYRYMADMAELTGGCHYAWDCEGYMKSCGSCPGLYSDNPKDETYENLNFKKAYINKTNVTVVAGSAWQMGQAAKSTLYGAKPRYKILSSTDENLFNQGNKIEVRKELNLPTDKKIIFFGAVNNSEKRKGGKELVEALVFLNNSISDTEKNNIHLLIAGNKPDSRIMELGFSITNLGYVNYAVLAKAYQASDVFVCPSIEDSGPSMINQSIMSGTPVVSFLMGVAIDLVINGQTGYAAELKNSKDLAHGLKTILDLNKGQQIEYSNSCRLLAYELCSYGVVAEKFSKLISNYNIKEEIY